MTNFLDTEGCQNVIAGILLGLLVTIWFPNNKSDSKPEYYCKNSTSKNLTPEQLHNCEIYFKNQ